MCVCVRGDRYVRTIYEVDINGNPMRSGGSCTSEHSITFLGMLVVFHLVLLLAGCRLAYKTSGISAMQVMRMRHNNRARMMLPMHTHSRLFAAASVYF